MKNFITIKQGVMYLNNNKITLRGFGIGSWMNIEHFMIGLPGTEKMMRKVFAEVYGAENAKEFFNSYTHDFFTEDDLIFLKSMGINVVRLALNYRHFEDDQNPGFYNEDGFAKVNRALELCKKHEIYVILDMHAAPGGQNPDWHADNETGISSFWEDSASRKRLIFLWADFAQRYRDETIIAGYDIVNEPCLVSDHKAFNDFFMRAIDNIRRYDNNHIIFIEGDDWGKDFSIFKQLGGHQQAISFHLYPNQHVAMTDTRAQRHVKLKKFIDPLLELRAKYGMPLWCGETGSGFTKDKITLQYGLVKDMLDLLETHDISWTLWSYKDAMAMSILYPKPETAWAKMVEQIKTVWTGDSNPSMAAKTIDFISKQTNLEFDERLKYKLTFRYMSIMNLIYSETLLKSYLKSVPWEQMKDYPQSWLFKNCGVWQEIVELVKSYTKV